MRNPIRLDFHQSWWALRCHLALILSRVLYLLNQWLRSMFEMCAILGLLRPECRAASWPQNTATSLYLTFLTSVMRVASTSISVPVPYSPPLHLLLWVLRCASPWLGGWGVGLGWWGSWLMTIPVLMAAVSELWEDWKELSLVPIWKGPVYKML